LRGRLGEKVGVSEHVDETRRDLAIEYLVQLDELTLSRVVPGAHLAARHDGMKGDDDVVHGRKPFAVARYASDLDFKSCFFEYFSSYGITKRLARFHSAAGK
jgi:hypothetical protein